MCQNISKLTSLLSFKILSIILLIYLYYLNVFCLEKSSKYTVLNEIGNHLLDKVVEQVKAGKTFAFVIDNIDVH